ncbi:hypothetical protein IGI37_003200 [Enterococcus sp. AZ194]|uniref:sirohydrochlorin chelatase n=1 Tax=Enterococcus sp. AZ194 TaxID=2774629 RepID=UPI003F23BB2E
MKKGIIFVLHGRKEKISTKNQAVVQSVIDELPVPGVIGLLEGEQQTLEEAMATLLEQTIEEIIFVPVLLFPATHAKEDLPERASAFLNGKARIRILETLATTQAVEEFLVRTIREQAGDGREVLVIAHGTPHYEEPYEQLETLAKSVERTVGIPVHTANHLGQNLYMDFLAGHPEGVVIQPLFLTDGFLIKKITTAIQEARGLKDFFLPTMEESPELKAAILERVREVVCIPS